MLNTMFSFVGTIFAKITSALASVIIAAGIVSVPVQTQDVVTDESSTSTIAVIEAIEENVEFKEIQKEIDTSSGQKQTKNAENRRDSTADINESTISTPKISDQTPEVPIDNVEVSNRTVSIGNGGIAEVDQSGNIIRYIKEPKINQTASPANVIPPTTQQTPHQNLKIESVNTTTTLNSAQIEWNTNIPTESKIFITDKNSVSRVVISESGFSTRHLINITDLDHNSMYSYEIEAIDTDNRQASVKDTFTTDDLDLSFETVVMEGNGDETKIYIRSNKKIDPEDVTLISSSGEILPITFFKVLDRIIDDKYVARFSLSEPVENFVEDEMLNFHVRVKDNKEYKLSSRKECRIFHSDEDPDVFEKQHGIKLESIQDKCQFS